MDKQFICDGEAYELVPAPVNVIGLPVTIGSLPEKLVIDGIELLRRPQFHVSLVCMGQIGAAAFVPEIVKDFCAYTAEHPVLFTRFTGEFRFVTSGERKTLVALCEVSNLKGFFDHIITKYGLTAEYPPTHVTLYTLGGGPGVFLTSVNDIETLTQIVPKPASITL